MSRGQTVKLTDIGLAWHLTAGRRHDRVNWRGRRGVINGMARDGRQAYVRWEGRRSVVVVPTKFLEIVA